MVSQDYGRSAVRRMILQCNGKIMGRTAYYMGMRITFDLSRKDWCEDALVMKNVLWDLTNFH